MRCLSDGYERTGGTVAVFGHAIARTPPQGVVGLGIGRSFQTTSLFFETLTVAESLRLARYRLDGTRMLSHAPTLALPDSALRVITATGLDRQLAIECRHLSHGMKRALELAMVLALEPSVLLLDEPTAGLTKPERTLIGSILVALVQREGLCTLIIEHDLDFVREISTRIIVLHQGKVLLDGSVAEVAGSELVRTIYAGGRASGAGAMSPTVLDIADLSSGYGEAIVPAQCFAQHPARRNLCPAWQERHGQEHSPQNGTRLPPGPEGRDQVVRGGRHGPAHPFDRAQGYCLHPPRSRRCSRT